MHQKLKNYHWALIFPNIIIIPMLEILIELILCFIENLPMITIVPFFKNV